MRPGERFLRQRGLLLGDWGFEADPGGVERTASGFAFYHYTRPGRQTAILGTDGGLRARLPTLASELTPELDGCYEVQGLLEPLPRWVTDSPYFGDLGMELVKAYVGDVLLRVEVPANFAGLYVWDYAHTLECKHVTRRGRPALGLGYDCRTGHEAVRASTHSYIPLAEYPGGHVAPVVAVLRRGAGLVIPGRFVSVARVQPRVPGQPCGAGRKDGCAGEQASGARPNADGMARKSRQLRPGLS